MNKKDWEKMNTEDQKRQVATIVKRYRQSVLPIGFRTYKNFASALSQVLHDHNVDITVNHQTIWNWEKARTLPRKDTLQLIIFHSNEGAWRNNFASEILKILSN